MADILSEIKTEFPRFIVNLVNIISSPRKTLLKLSKYEDGHRENAMTKAVIYFVLSCLICSLWIVPIYGEEAIWSKTSFIYAVSVPLVFLVLGSLAIKISWKIVGNETSYWDYIVVFSYQIGTFLNIYLFTNFLNLSLLKYNSSNTFKQAIRAIYSDIPGREDLLNDSNTAYNIFLIIGFIFLIISLVWFYYSWNVYRQLNKTSRSKSLLAATIYSAFMTIVFFINLIIFNALE